MRKLRNPSFTAYFDCGGSAEDPQVKALGVGACVASDHDWQLFAREWSTVLQAEGVTMLHMRAFAHSREEFADWKSDEDRRARFLESLSSVLNRRVRKKIMVMFSLDDYRKLNSEVSLEETVGPPYVLATCFASVMVDHWMKEHHPGKSVRRVLEKGDRHQNKCLLGCPKSAAKNRR